MSTEATQYRGGVMTNPIYPSDVVDGEFESTMNAIIERINDMLKKGKDAVIKSGKWEVCITIAQTEGNAMFNLWKAYHNEIVHEYVKRGWSLDYEGYGKWHDPQPSYLVRDPKYIVFSVKAETVIP